MGAFKVSLWSNEVEGKTVLRYSRSFCRQFGNHGGYWTKNGLRFDLTLHFGFILSFSLILGRMFPTFQVVPCASFQASNSSPKKQSLFYYRCKNCVVGWLQGLSTRYLSHYQIVFWIFQFFREYLPKKKETLHCLVRSQDLSTRFLSHHPAPPQCK